MVNPFAAALERIKDRLAMMVGRGVLAALEADGGLMRAGIEGVADEVLDGRDFVLDYGLSSRPHPGAEALMLFLAGLRSNGVVVRLFDRRYCLKLEYGEVAIHDDLGQKVHLTRAGVVVETPLDATVKAGRKLRLEAEDIEMHAARSWSWDVDGYGQRIASQGGGAYQLHTWQQGAVMAPAIVDPIKPPEGP